MNIREQTLHSLTAYRQNLTFLFKTIVKHVGSLGCEEEEEEEV